MVEVGTRVFLKRNFPAYNRGTKRLRGKQGVVLATMMDPRRECQVRFDDDFGTRWFHPNALEEV